MFPQIKTQKYSRDQTRESLPAELNLFALVSVTFITVIVSYALLFLGSKGASLSSTITKSTSSPSFHAPYTSLPSKYFSLPFPFLYNLIATFYHWRIILRKCIRFTICTDQIHAFYPESIVRCRAHQYRIAIYPRHAFSRPRILLRILSQKTKHKLPCHETFPSHTLLCMRLHLQMFQYHSRWDGYSRKYLHKCFVFKLTDTRTHPFYLRSILLSSKDQ